MENLQDNLTGVNQEGFYPNRPLRYLTATSIVGDKVHNSAGEHLGIIKDIMIDLGTGNNNKINWALSLTFKKL